MQLPIYLDYMATTPVDPQVFEAMRSCLGLDGCFGNPASQTHRFGWDASEKVNIARQQVAALLNADPREIIWTSGATESDNLAIKGAMLFYQRQGKHIITLKTEHKAVLDTCAYLETQGFNVTYLPTQESGLLDLDQLRAAIRPDTILVSIMHVNNETGVIQDLKAIAEIVKAKGILFHVDAAQSAGKIELDVTEIPVDLVSLSAHKIYGPKGIGALYVRRNPRVRLVPLIHGGGHEQGLRSGTLATHQIVGMGTAFAIAKERIQQDFAHCKALSDVLWQGLSQEPYICLNGDPVKRIPHCLNISFTGVDNETLIASLPSIAVSSGSACNSASQQVSHVLMGMGVTPKRAQQSVRISMGRFTTMEQIEYTIAQFTEKANYLRNLSLPIVK